MEYSFVEIGILAVLAIFLLLLYVAFAKMRGSYLKGAADIVEIGIVGLAYVLSFLASVIRWFGKLVPFTSFYERIFSKYPGSAFTQDRREEFIERGIVHIEREGYDIEQSQEELIEEIRSLHEKAGRQLSDGEVLFGLTLATVGYFSIGPKLLLTVLSFGLVLAVMARLTALKTILYENPSSDESRERLLVMAAWNRAMTNGVKILSNLAALKFTRGIDEQLYEIYLDRILDRAFEDDIGKLEAGRTLYRPFLCITLAKNNEKSRSEISLELFGEDIFETDQVPDKNIDETGMHKNVNS